jgi:arsenate reductase-like glutaredoxin family protein
MALRQAEKGVRNGYHEKQLMELAEQLGLGGSIVSKSDRMSDLADKYKGKSDQELISEIMKVKQSLKRDKAQYEKQMKAIKALRSMMTGEQKARLEKLIRLLEAED